MELSARARLADHLLDGGLKAKLAAWRADGKSWDWIAKTLWLETGQEVSVTGPTVQSWAKDCGVAA